MSASSYTGPATVVTDQGDIQVRASLQLTRGQARPGWYGTLTVLQPPEASLWEVLNKGAGRLRVGERVGDFMIPSFTEPGACPINGSGEPPF